MFAIHGTSSGGAAGVANHYMLREDGIALLTTCGAGDSECAHTTHDSEDILLEKCRELNLRSIFILDDAMK